jgi:hypothetical protein
MLCYVMLGYVMLGYVCLEWGSGVQISGDQNRRLKVFMIRRLNFSPFSGDQKLQ